MKNLNKIALLTTSAMVLVPQVAAAQYYYSPPESTMYSPPESPPYMPPYSPTYSPPESPPYMPPESPPYMPPESPPYMPPESPPYTPPESPCDDCITYETGVLLDREQNADTFAQKLMAYSIPAVFAAGTANCGPTTSGKCTEGQTCTSWGTDANGKPKCNSWSPVGPVNTPVMWPPTSAGPNNSNVVLCKKFECYTKDSGGKVTPIGVYNPPTSTNGGMANLLCAPVACGSLCK